MNYIVLYSDAKIIGIEKYNYKEISNKSFFSIDKEIDFSEKLKINDKLYSTCCGLTLENDKDYCFLVEEFKFEDEIDTKIESEITCPYCNYELSDSWDYSSDEDDIDCENCDSLFSYTREITVDYWCKPISKNEEIKELFND